ncbi:U11/U12 small nuclear ribonucleoprotein 65 kDa protein isoform X2 [Drosophila miranda]|uniref:U11/U12 small nuclear ribonucleoprotein 65 kDa protein isoform X2 n=1 Tax=Drosophila miranda TaxID=7229 RepID=UPI00143F9257|nr:U11/U12 small nuclear ribonucleoprotein 65 kDa protein isoform X2 [Drosophila miranda]
MQIFCIQTKFLNFPSNMSVETSKLLIKKLPCDMDELAQLIRECKLIIPRSLSSYGCRRAVIEYADAGQARKALEELNGLNDILDKPLCVIPFGPRVAHDGSRANKCTQTKPPPSESTATAKKEIRNYPPINAEILARIGETLQADTRFYQQVLHLMNRMNLEPPFKRRSSFLVVQSHRHSVGIQTEIIPSESESELESDETEPRAKRKCLKPSTSIAAKEKNLKRARQIVQQAVRQAIHLKPKQESLASSFAAPKIELKLPQTLNPTVAKPAKRLSRQELEALPVYKNYNEGDPSNKLYIKNLHKNIGEEQLRELYSQYTTPENLEIKVMQQGRMKGQAFVTFIHLPDPEVIATALDETNGLLWEQKPMIVCYGKKI